jgi:hypothetical protein
MSLSNSIEKETAAYSLQTFENLSIQDALTIIAIFAAQMVADNCEKDIERIAAVSENHPDFAETKEDILKRINKFVNAMLAADDPLKAVEIAKEALTPKMRNTAFEMAAEVALADKLLSNEKKAVLKTLASELSIDSKFYRKTIEKFTG